MVEGNHKIKQQIHEIIFEADTFYGKLFDIILLCAIILSILLVILESVESINTKYSDVLIETPANDGSGAIKKIRVGFANNTPQFSLQPDLALSGADVFITASLDEYIEADNKISGSGLRKAFVDAINNGFGTSNIANFSASEQGLIVGDSALTFMRATPISSVTNLPWDGNFYKCLPSTSSFCFCSLI